MVVKFTCNSRVSISNISRLCITLYMCFRVDLKETSVIRHCHSQCNYFIYEFALYLLSRPIWILFFSPSLSVLSFHNYSLTILLFFLLCFFFLLSFLSYFVCLFLSYIIVFTGQPISILFPFRIIWTLLFPNPLK